MTIPGKLHREMNCPLCNSNQVRDYLKNGSLIIKTCLTCGNGWTFPAPDNYDYEEDNFHASSGLEQPKNLSDLPPRWQKCIKMQVDLLSTVITSESDIILEVGCGEGILLAELRNKGYNVKGIEPSKTAAKIAKNKDLDVVEGYYPEAIPKSKFKVLILSHVLEHLPDPKVFFTELAKNIDTEYVFLVQTNFKGLMPRWLRNGWHGWAPEQHYWHFTADGIKEILKLANVPYKVKVLEYSSMEYMGSRMAKLVDIVSKIYPGVYDQMHILIETKKNKLR